jgi:hypothetical protein
MTNEKIEGFLEKVNMNYLFCLLSKLEAQRINQFPSFVKNKFEKKSPPWQWNTWQITKFRIT